MIFEYLSYIFVGKIVFTEFNFMIVHTPHCRILFQVDVVLEFLLMSDRCHLEISAMLFMFRRPFGSLPRFACVKQWFDVVRWG
jgi:hypothetical protein